ncbi:phosphopantothenoylcysteine decarboxylase/phosphopantothenate--cysteine ligase, putative [Trichomonas vaginalis G3]|uniref:Phosphopantothenoylcysteine decarboxylase/phosphopantothenate--cysteine ligase, putative n=1 Tax=Trichomonas vaginalis (strain ATCC PRA-98 / G3) TaxID=412133 RepID=A2EXW4_TRIV3|nr:phosphopantothenoylcysteine decarboxylase / phosphopantothenate--cysteine ligase family [Trichomonas vaginalis G3]EAY02497.1 phosphopantothenoylcysteine decarboxylase/phosphopantothenate--cysteine ligase, putative [Trichomonas vaginalis G3]KAI5529073.1 phosphopantothenoylcysteine decarboxylase / phosphopantothenate--cysteine ligase family [Trichomonas vaginalis G3]|eukprot:XP_001314736.1 phosphopantothenoylcysteine decarboxylase/phosphopantothenate--cysteine ligase [Trichomonas
MFEGKNIVIGITGGIAAYKMATLASMLGKTKASVHIIMTENAEKFITPVTFEALVKTKVHVDTFDREYHNTIAHIELAKNADIFLVSPASANFIAKASHGMADDMLTTTFLAAKCPKFVAPAMNTAMLENPITQDNIKTLQKYGIEIIQPSSGMLACGDVGSGKMAEPEVIFSYIERVIARNKDMIGKNVLVTAGATRESLDPVRFITNHSTGKMGFAIAKEAMLRGANVTIVKAMTSAPIPPFVKIIEVDSAEHMFEKVTEISDQMDIVIKAAAVADYTPIEYSDEKVKKKDGDLEIKLKRTKDILMYLGEHRRENQFICGFSMETENLVENSTLKLNKKKADMIVANNLKVQGAGFGTDTNLVTLITKEGAHELEMMSKEKVSEKIFDKILEMMKK